MKRYVLLIAVLSSINCNDETPTQLQSSPKTSVIESSKMPPKLAASAVTKKTLNIGVETVIQSNSPIGRYQAVFEDDADTGYFYALDSEKEENPIIDALHIYNVKAVTDKDNLHNIHIIWSQDGMKVAMFLNSYPHAIYNFTDDVGCCRTGFPPAIIDGSISHDWDDSQMTHFYAKEDKKPSQTPESE